MKRSHRRRFRGFPGLTLVAITVVAGLPPMAAAQEWTSERTMEVRRVGDVVPSPDGDWVAFEVTTPVLDEEASEWRTHIHLARADGSGSEQLTRGDASASSPAWSPDGEWIGFLADRGEGTEVWRIGMRGEARPVTDAPEDVSAFAWAPEGDRIAYLMRDPESDETEEARREKRDPLVVGDAPRMVGLYVADVASDPGAGRRLSPADVSVQAWTSPVMEWSPDGASVAFVHQPSPDVNDWPRADVSVVDVASGRVRAVAASAAAEGGVRYSPDGRLLAYTASDDPATWAFTWDTYVVPAEGGEPRALARTFDRQANLLGWSPDGRSLLVEETHGTVRRVQRLPLDGGDPVDLSPPDFMVSGPTLNRTGTVVGFVSEAPDRPPEPHVAVLPDFTTRQVSRVQELGDVRVGRTEVVRWRSPDGLEVEGLLTYPEGYREGTRVPLLVVVHGGPTGVFTRGFIGGASQYPVAVFASQGHAVLRPNPRGSSGYGREFRYANYEDWGGGDYRDIMAGVDAMIERGVADPERLGVMGWSYGGYMTSWIVTQTDRFAAASIGAALPNLVSFSGTSDVPGFIPDYFGGEFWERPEVWLEHSPLFQVGGATTPSLIQHGEADERVPVSQAREFHRALERQGVETSLVIYPRQPHGIREPKLLVDAMERNLAWFSRWLSSRRISDASQEHGPSTP